VFVADAQALARFGLVQLINSHARLCVCGEAESLPRARELIAKLQPEVVVFDPAMGEGFAFVQDLPRWSPGTRAVALTNLCDALSVQRALKAGVCGYVARRDSVEAVLMAIVRVAEGERHLGPRVEEVLLEGMARGAMAVQEGDGAVLSDRELQVFRLIGQGLGTRALAVELRVSVKTVETHRQRIREKLGVATGNELQRRAVLFCDRAEGAPRC
jgi:DNA-binding NarL/FixJ family response regulator